MPQLTLWPPVMACRKPISHPAPMGRAEKGRADTHVSAHDGRAVWFVTSEPSGLTATLPAALAELTKAAGPGAKIMLGFDRGGACPRYVHGHQVI